MNLITLNNYPIKILIDINRCDFDGKKGGRQQTFCSELDYPHDANSAGEINRDFMGASMAMVEDQLVTCATRTRADRYSDPGSTTGTCYQV